MKASQETNVWQLISIFLIGIMVGVGMIRLDDYVRGDKEGKTNIANVDKQVQAQPAVQPTIEAQLPLLDVVTKVGTDGHYYMGEDNAKVVIYEFGDYHCGFCKKFFQGTLPQVVEKYVKTGQVKFVFRDYLLGGPELANVARCAGDQQKYWQMHSLLFNRGSEVSNGDYSVFVKELGLNADTFNQCVSSQKYYQAIDKDVQDGVKAGVEGVPAFIVNGKLVKGYKDFAGFEKVILDALK